MFSEIRYKCRDAVNDLGNFIKKRYRVDDIYFQGMDMVYVTDRIERVSPIDVIDWLAGCHKIYLNIHTSIVGMDVRFDFFFNFVDGGVLNRTSPEHDFESYEKMLEKASVKGIWAVHRRMKEDTL